MLRSMKLGGFFERHLFLQITATDDYNMNDQKSQKQDVSFEKRREENLEKSQKRSEK